MRFRWKVKVSWYYVPCRKNEEPVQIAYKGNPVLEVLNERTHQWEEIPTVEVENKDYPKVKDEPL